MTLHDPRREHDACGIGFVADANGTPSRRIVDAALQGLCGVRHRGAVAADARTGDGAGVLVPLPAALLVAEAGLELAPERLGAAMCFLDGGEGAAGDAARDVARAAVAEALATSGLHLLAWREVPVVPEVLGDRARAQQPRIEQALFDRGDLDDEAAERACYLARKRAEARIRAESARGYFASWSTRTMTYKAMSAADQLAAFYPDLGDPRVTGWYAIFHQRYSTNTVPTWERAQPFRFLGHNGEINTIAGNGSLMRARHGRLGADWPELGEEGEALLAPVLDAGNSDSARLDNALELLVRGGMAVSF